MQFWGPEGWNEGDRNDVGHDENDEIAVALDGHDGVRAAKATVSGIGGCVTKIATNTLSSLIFHRMSNSLMTISSWLPQT